MLTSPYWFMEEIEEINEEGYPLRVYKKRPHSLDQALRNSANRFPKREAIVFGQERWTYEICEEKIDRVASALKENYGIGPGDRIAFLMGNHGRWALTFLAIARVGGISVPLNNRLQSAEILYQINNSQTRLLIFDSEFAGRILPIQNDLQTVTHLIINGQTDASEASNYDELEAYPSRNLSVPRTEKDGASILYTSGTTGIAKGALLTNRNMISIAMVLADMLQYNETDRMLFFIPLFHVTGLVGMFMPMIIQGGANIVLPGFKRHEIPQVIEEEKITATMGVPATFILMLESPNYFKFSRKTMRSILYGGAPSPPDMHQNLKETLPEDCLLTEGYGLTEASSNVTMFPTTRDRHVLSRYGSIGVANPLADLRIIDDKGNDVPEASVGELLVRDPGVMAGYWNAPDKTKEAIKSGWLHTGDLVSRDKDGYLSIKGRKKHMIIRGGENIYPVEIENVLYSHPQILEAAVLGIPDRVMGEEVKAVIVPKEGISLGVDHIKEFLRSRLADYKIPKYISFAQELPRNPAGKVVIDKLINC
jgi:long-chain acyl-CoA synthetase